MPISGTIRPIYNEFEEYVTDIIGDIQSKYGLVYEYYCLQRTFEESEQNILKIGQERIVEIASETDPNTRWSLSRDPEFSAISVNNVHYLRTSYLVTVHSYFEANWGDIQSFLKEIPVSLKYNVKISNAVLATAINNFTMLFDYNFIRNAFTHPKGVGDEAKVLKKLIEDQVIRDIMIDSDFFDKGKLKLEITHLDFVNDYADLILKFLQNIIDVSYSSRT